MSKDDNSSGVEAHWILSPCVGALLAWGEWQGLLGIRRLKRIRNCLMQFFIERRTALLMQSH